MASTWRITGQVADQTQILTSGQVVTGHVVFFATGLGNRDSVFVPDDHYNAAAVRTLVQAQADTVDEVGELSNGKL